MRLTVCELADDVERRKAAWEEQICTEMLLTDLAWNIGRAGAHIIAAPAGRSSFALGRSAPYRKVSLDRFRRAHCEPLQQGLNRQPEERTSALPASHLRPAPKKIRSRHVRRSWSRHGSGECRVYSRRRTLKGDAPMATAMPAVDAGAARELALRQLGDEIAELAAHLDAATARLLELIRDFDARGGWG